MKIVQKTKMKRNCLLLLAIALQLMANATVIALDSTRHEVRVGWGDFQFESLVYPNNASEQNHRYMGHLFAEYQYQINSWLSVGAQVDYSQVWWDKVAEGGVALAVPYRANYFNICLMPAVRFTYYYHPWVTLYSAVYMGLNINSGTELNYKGEKTALAYDFGATLLGVKVGHNGWFGAVEIGGLSSLKGAHEIYMLDSRIWTVSLGHRF